MTGLAIICLDNTGVSIVPNDPGDLERIKQEIARHLSKYERLVTFSTSREEVSFEQSKCSDGESLD